MQIGQAAVGSIAHQICRDHSGISQRACGVPASEVHLDARQDRRKHLRSGGVGIYAAESSRIPAAVRVRLIHREEVKQLDGSATVVSQVCVEELLNSGWPILEFSRHQRSYRSPAARWNWEHSDHRLPAQDQNMPELADRLHRSVGEDRGRGRSIVDRIIGWKLERASDRCSRAPVRSTDCS